MQIVLDAITRWGGLASTSELLASGVDRSTLDVAVMYGRVLRVRKGLWAAPSTPAAVVLAHRSGGRLACVSALEFHGLINKVGPDLHISAPEWVSRWRVRRRPGVVRHWSRRRRAGDRFAVSPIEAWAQFARCHAVVGCDVRLRRTDSL